MKAYQRVERTKRDAEAPGYDRWYVANKGALFDARERDVFQRLVAGRSFRNATDIGAGTGRISEAIAPLVRNVVSVDVSVVSLRLLADKQIRSCTPVSGNASALPIRDGAFDLAISCQVLQHLRFDELIEGLQEIHRVLTPDGWLIFSGYNLGYVRYRGVVEEGDPNGSYVRRFTEGSVRYLAEATGFGVVRIGYYKALPFRLLKGTPWIAVDRALSRVPALRSKVDAFLVAVLRRRA